mgnify:CR=1 FL=1
MTVYVDDMRRKARVGRINGVWSHLVADTHDELVAFAVGKLGMWASWIQEAGTELEHFDVTDSVRAKAIRLGAVEITYPHGIAEVVARKLEGAAAEGPGGD